MNTVSEADFQRALIDTIGADPHFRIWRQLVGNFFWCDSEGVFHPVRVGPPKGAADLAGFVWGSGRHIELEVKSASGTLSKEQKAWGGAMKAGGPIHHVAQYDETMSFEDNVQLALEEVRRQAGI